MGVQEAVVVADIILSIILIFVGNDIRKLKNQLSKMKEEGKCQK